MSEHFVPKLGEIITDGEVRRDAVHVAVSPVVAAERLRPGQHVCFAKDGDTSSVCGLPHKGNLGIVDPFLTEDVLPGQSCWMFLYPRTITGLRHLWTHPAFRPKVPEAHP